MNLDINILLAVINLIKYVPDEKLEISKVIFLLSPETLTQIIFPVRS